MAVMKIMIGLSGGVDSAVAAYLLKRDGHEVTACFMRNWDALANGDYLGNPTINNEQCPQEKDWDDACAVAKKLDIPIMRIDFVKEYWDEVFSFFLSEYKKGRTPNPDIFCNKYVKFDAFLKFAKSKGFDMIAMGHYAKRIDRNGKAYLLKSFDLNKDQTYFLSQISQEQLKSSIFPLGDIDKTEVRKIAHQLGLSSVMDKKDSTGICFIGERDFKKFLENYIPAKKGKIVDIENNRIIGQHDGVMYYTIGQRKGLGLGGISGELAKGWFVVKKDVINNILYVASGDENDYLYSTSCIVKNLNFITDRPQNGSSLMAKFRYRQKDNPVKINFIDEDTLELVFATPYKAVTTGQAAVLYDGDICLGGGLIEEVYRNKKRIDI
ncbi:MAG: tRNA 2-thiouridine(34) synthase MnmA [Erysipelotrichaceae bacterium]|nr:tRNA 2-thiouridine(34) synthase MnmA [Erysipelotrichaceae bacterium]